MRPLPAPRFSLILPLALSLALAPWTVPPLRAEMSQESLSPGGVSAGGEDQGAEPDQDSTDAGQQDGSQAGPVASPTPRPGCGLISTVAGDGQQGSDGDQGPALSAQLDAPLGLCLDAHGDLFIADRGNEEVREVNASDGTIHTVAGDGTAGFQGDGGPADEARLSQPSAVCVDAQGDLYLSDTLNNRVRKVDPSGNISTFAGTGLGGYNGDGGPASEATLQAPQGLCLDASGNLYIAEPANHVVRKVDSGGLISTVAGNGTSGDDGDGGQAVAATLEAPVAVCVGPDNSLYIADAGASVVRKVDPSGNISTVAGNGFAGYGGDEGSALQAQLDHPYAVAVDAAGNLIIADSGNHALRQVDPGGAITPLAGDGSAGTFGDGGPAAEAEFGSPEGLALDALGDLFISDMANETVREIRCP